MVSSTTEVNESSASIFTLSVPGSLDKHGDEVNEARGGCIQLKGRKPMATPNFFAATSRGVVPHMTPDVISEHSTFEGIHLALEDCMYHGIPEYIHSLICRHRKSKQ